MSVALWVIPVGLVMRVAMGKQKFEEFINNSQIRYEINVKDESELLYYLKKSGLSVEKLGKSYKSHYLKNSKRYFFWDKILNKWYASFSKYDDFETIEEIFNVIEKAAGKELFVNKSEQSQSLEENPLQKLIFPTDFCDADRLKRVLTKFSIPINTDENGIIITTVAGVKIIFTPSETGPYTFEVQGVENFEEIFSMVKIFDEDYKAQIQQDTYVRVKEQASESGYVIENEERLEDKTIVLTINLD
ncbi:MAG: hypothetical protein WC002_03355 [Candidatus Muiribacteriota bacterium]